MLTIPMIVGLILTLTLSMRAITKTGRYRIFPILGSVTALGMLRLTRLTGGTPIWLVCVMLFVLGSGLGFIMQARTPRRRSPAVGGSGPTGHPTRRGCTADTPARAGSG